MAMVPRFEPAPSPDFPVSGSTCTTGSALPRSWAASAFRRSRQRAHHLIHFLPSNPARQRARVSHPLGERCSMLSMFVLPRGSSSGIRGVYAAYRAGKQRNLAPGRMPGVTVQESWPAARRISYGITCATPCAASVSPTKPRSKASWRTESHKKNPSKNSVEGRLTRHSLPPLSESAPVANGIPQKKPVKELGRGQIDPS